MPPDDLPALSLRLLERKPPPGPLVPPEVLVPGALPDLVAILARPGTPAGPAELASLCLKYAHAYVHPERLEEDVSLDELTAFAGRFVRRRGGCSLLAGQGELRRLLLHHGFALQMLLDLPKTVHLLTALLSANPAPGPEFLGLDCGTGTGILLLGQYLLARRLGVAAPTLVGFEMQPQVAARADALLAALAVGRVRRADATQAATYAGLPPGPVTCLANETLPSAGRRLYKEPFAAICATLFAVLGPRLENTFFVPEAVWASDRAGREWLRLCPQNAFAGEGQGHTKPLRLAFMREVELAGRRLAVERVGEELSWLVAAPWREALCRRW
jgi:hypothetical protein